MLISKACTEVTPAKSEEYLKGEAIAQRVCSSCHIYTPPELLDQIAWPNVLSVMNAEMKKVGREPEYNDWIATQRFYLTQAPRSFPSTSIKKPEEQQFFEPVNIRGDSLYHSMSTMLHFDSLDNTISVGQQNGSITEYDIRDVKKQYKFPNVPIDKKGDHILGMGSLGPSEDVNGELYRSDGNNFKSIAGWMNRPIHFEAADLNNDGEDEYVISSFGSPTDGAMTGELNLVTKSDGEFEKRILDPLPGATLTRVIDLNKDGLLDVVGLFSQGNEMINVYYNQGDLQFRKSTLLNFPPVYGTNSFDLADMNGDGHVDLLVTSGDNDDYSQVFKPYHGIRIFLNNGENKFEEGYAYNINGASKVLQSDFDLDGDADFVVLAMYPDLFSRPWETLQYFENNGRMKFTINYFEPMPSDNWILMEIGDIDGDGDSDIITAANQRIHGVLPPQLEKRWKKNAVGIKVWENSIR